MAKQEEQRKKLTCPLCKCTFPNKEFYDSHHLIEARDISDMMVEEYPGFVDAMAKISENKREIKDIGRKIEFLEGIKRRQVAFEIEQRQREIEFLDEIKQSAIDFKEERQQRADKKRVTMEELKACLREGKTPTTAGLMRLVSEE